MSWFYMDGEREVGPLGRAEMQEAVRTGAITADTLIRDERSSQWKTYRQMREEARQKGGGGPQAGPASAGGVACSECGRLFPEDEVINYKGYNVCASCKPVFIQKLREGARLPGSMVYGGFWIRGAAKLIDYVIFWMVNAMFSTVLSAVAGLTAAGGAAQPDINPIYIVMVVLTMLLQIGVPMFYTTYLVGKYGATLGKMACGLKIVTAEGERVSYLRAFARYFAEGISAMILMIGYIMAAFDEEKRTLHDRICSTRVIKK
jgi:uncharacterized RDD family membrane protein YckC